MFLNFNFQTVPGQNSVFQAGINVNSSVKTVDEHQASSPLSSILSISSFEEDDVSDKHSFSTKATKAINEKQNETLYSEQGTSKTIHSVNVGNRLSTGTSVRGGDFTSAITASNTQSASSRQSMASEPAKTSKSYKTTIDLQIDNLTSENKQLKQEIALNRENLYSKEQELNSLAQTTSQQQEEIQQVSFFNSNLLTSKLTRQMSSFAGLNERYFKLERDSQLATISSHQEIEALKQEIVSLYLRL